MIFLLNREYVMWEVVELARLHICEVLRVSTKHVEATLDLADGRMSPEFQVDLDECPGATPEQIREVMQAAYLDCKSEAEVRLKGITQKRSDVLEWLRGGMTDEEYQALRDPAAFIDPEVMAEALAVQEAPRKRSLARAVWIKTRWRLRDARRWVRLMLVGLWRRITFWR